MYTISWDLYYETYTCYKIYKIDLYYKIYTITLIL